MEAVQNHVINEIPSTTTAVILVDPESFNEGSDSATAPPGAVTLVQGRKICSPKHGFLQ